MTPIAAFFIGMLVGGTIGVFAMGLVCGARGKEPRE